MEGSNKLTDKQQAFIREYLVDFNATQAAIRAGYSEKTARSQGQRLLTNVDIQQALARRTQQLIQKTEVAIDNVVAELASIAFANMKNYAKWHDGGVSLIDSEILTKEQGAVVAEISERDTKDGRYVRFKLHDKVAALGKLEKYLELGQMGMVSWKNVLEALVEMSRAVEMYVTDPETIDKIKQAWSRIPVRPQGFGRS